jgi:hypothetical protein
MGSVAQTRSKRKSPGPSTTFEPSSYSNKPGMVSHETKAARTLQAERVGRFNKVFSVKSAQAWLCDEE